MGSVWGNVKKDVHPSSKGWAFVTMAHDPPGEHKYLLRALAIARALQRLSAYPLILLTNASHFADGTSTKDAFRKLNVQILPLYRLELGTSGKKSSRRIADWKLQAWDLVDFQKLIWIDTDAVLFRPLDWLFHRPGMWAQRNDRLCKDKGALVSSGLMLLYPSSSDYHGILKFAKSDEGGDLDTQTLINKYFSDIRHRAFNLLSSVEAAYGQCLGKAATPYVNPDGSLVPGYWSMPAFVHESGGWGPMGDDYQNVCFSHELSQQKYYVGQSILNMCQYNPLAAHWRSLFCEAVALAGIHKTKDIGEFCSDSCYYFGQGSPCSGQVNATMTYPEYYAQTKGMPEPEVDG